MKTARQSNVTRTRHSDTNSDHAAYKAGVNAQLYRNYFTNLHASEQKVDTSATTILNQEVLRSFGRVRKKVLLDAGCGDGLFIASARKSGFRCEGMDSNRDLLAVCRKKGYAVKYGDLAERLPYPDRTFEGIFCSNVFEHLADPAFALYELLRILKDDGLLIITVPEVDRIFYNDWTHITPFTKQTLENLAKCVSFKEVRIYRREFPVLVNLWKNPFIRWGNAIVRAGLPARIFTFFVERIWCVRRHDLVLRIVK